MTPGLLEKPSLQEEDEDVPAEPGTERPALLAGEEHDVPDRHIFRGTD
ncbi:MULTISPECIES: hypothetical protein [unclassified Streptomyces]|nr:hypothetical protein [Streptomyces sp. NBC_00589]WTI38542.1 hypothetical protein OIC96_27915 [Streptomyces sp. NBC_00775]WUB27779.1 hypothetical protein OHA51_21820 [Streptomyces sp. NBC_00589]